MNPELYEYARRSNEGRPVDIRYAPPGVDSAVFSPLESRSPILDPNILCVGRFDDPRKNVSMLLEAFKLVKGAVGSLKLILAGQAGPNPEFWSRVRAEGLADSVEHISRPSIAELVKLYQRASVFALASNEEGFGVVIIEAMACGVPVVSTRSGGPQGIITDGFDGFTTPLNDPTTFAERILQLLTDEEMNIELGKRARATIVKRFSQEAAGRVFQDIWSRLLTRYSP